MSKKKKQKSATHQNNQENICHRMTEAVIKAKKTSERIFGCIPYEFEFIKVTYMGTSQKPAKITPIEKGIIGILSIDTTSSFEKIGSILGLDVKKDKAEESLLCSFIENLESMDVIERSDSRWELTEKEHICATKGEQKDKAKISLLYPIENLESMDVTERSDSRWELTEKGHIYATKGEQLVTYNKSFDIYVDRNHPSWHNIKNCIGNNLKNCTKDSNSQAQMICNFSLDEIKLYAECQARHVHYPQNRYVLKKASPEKECKIRYKVHIYFVQSITSSKDVRAFVYDENIKGLNTSMAEQINSNKDFMSELLKNYIIKVKEKEKKYENDEGIIVL